MTTKHLLLVLAGISALAACEPLPAPPAAPAEPQDACGAAAYQGLVGQPRTVLDGMTFSLGTRRIGPDDAVTADFRPDRLNIEYGASGRIERISCF